MINLNKVFCLIRHVYKVEVNSLKLINSEGKVVTSFTINKICKFCKKVNTVSISQHPEEMFKVKSCL